MTSRSPRMTWSILALVFLTFAVYGSLVPFHLRQTSFEEAVRQFWSELKNWSFALSGVDWGVNVALFVPISFCLLGAAAPTANNWHFRSIAVLLVVVFCAMATLAIEFAQNWVSSRVPSAADVFAQYLGTGLGVSAWLIVGDAANSWLAEYLKSTRRNQQIDWLVQAYVVGLLLYSVMPLDLTLRPGELYQKYKDGRIELIPFSHHYGSMMQFAYQIVADIAVCIPVGMFASTGWTSVARPVRPVPSSLAIGILVVVGIECVQFLVRERYSSVTDVLTGTVGVAIGIRLMRHRSHASPGALPALPVAWKWLLVGGLYSLALMVLFWAPFDFVFDEAQIRHKLSGFFVLPLSAAIMGARFVGLTSILRKAILFIPLGVLISLSTASLDRHYRRLARFALLLLAWTLGFAIELGQIALPNRSATFDDALICAVGTLVGLLVSSRILSASSREMP